MAFASASPQFPSLRFAILCVLAALLFLPLSESTSNPWNARSSALTVVGEGGGEGTVILRRWVAEVPPDSNLVTDNGSLVLAANRTYRRDPTDGYRRYTGGWNISNQHYWASVAFTAVPLFVVAAAWLVGFGLSLFAIGCCFCFCRRRSTSYSQTAYCISLVLLIIFTIAAIAGCALLYTGQGKFHGSTISTIDYVVGQSNLTVENLRNFSASLAAAKSIGVDQIFLPADVQSKIDVVETKLNASAGELSSRTLENSTKIKNVLNNMRSYLIIISAVMLGLALLGFLFSLCGLQCFVSILVIAGWIMVTVTFILCALFLLLHNVVADTCYAMDDWVTHPMAQSALDDVLPCVDGATANESMYRSREVTAQLVNLVNNVIVNVSNKNYPPILKLLYFNQSGPPVPPLCNPYQPDLSNRSCAHGEVDFDNAPRVWKHFVCEVSGSQICTTRGRITPTIYGQMIGAAGISQGLYQYGPFLTQLEDCTFVRETFGAIDANNCPGLKRYSKWTYVGLVLVSSALMLSLVFWLVYARERRHRMYGRQQFITQPGQQQHHPLQEQKP